MGFEEALEHAIAARIPGIFIQTLEEERAILGIMKAVFSIVNSSEGKVVPENYPVYRWSSVSMSRVCWERQNPSDPQSSYTRKVQVYPSEHQLSFMEILTEFLLPNSGRLEKGTAVAADVPGSLSSAILLICGYNLTYEGDVRKLRETLWALKGSCRTVSIIPDEDRGIPACLRIETANISLELPDYDTLKKVFEPSFVSLENSKSGIVVDKDSREPFLRACLGLTLVEARSIFARSMVESNKFTGDTVKVALREKANLIKSCAALEYREVTGSLDDVGGLEAAKRWVREVHSIWLRRKEAEEYGCSIPSGLLLAGIPGTGKTYLAERLASTWGLPLFMLDVGALFGPLLGSTEAAFRRFKEIIKAVRPCVVFIDEMEKALGGNGDIDGGASERLKGSLLTWLQDKPSDVFLVASVNDVLRFQRCPEILRAGRFDQIFWVELPDADTRKEVFRIHFRLSKHNPDDSDLAKSISLAAKEAEGYSPAEIRTAVKSSLRMAFRMGLKHPSKGQIFAALHDVTPLSRSMAGSIGHLRSWAEQVGAKDASGKEVL